MNALEVERWVLQGMANPNGMRATWGTGDVANRVRQYQVSVSTARVLTALRRIAKSGQVICLGTRESDGLWHGHDITRNQELVWRLDVAAARAFGNVACRTAVAAFEARSAQVSA